ncbi:hypothetical protein DKG71_34595 [Streptomyces sp. NEAU-S7GS2]|nr:hypothetical protein DKG71_34595 [Streptomyces sp. NEAU-S7GS2]
MYVREMRAAQRRRFFSHASRSVYRGTSSQTCSAKTDCCVGGTNSCPARVVLARADPTHSIKTQFVFSTLSGNGSTTAGIHEWGAFRDQVVLLLIFAITDLLNTPPCANMAPLINGLVVVAIGTDAGYAINPARDFGPRLASFITGYRGAWRDQWGSLYFWVPIVGPLIGGVLGASIYKFLIGNEPCRPRRRTALEASSAERRRQGGRSLPGGFSSPLREDPPKEVGPSPR